MDIPIEPKMSYIERVLISLDELGNVLSGGMLDETISSRSGRAALHGARWGLFMAWWLGKIVPNHCRLAELHDEQRAEFIVWLEQSADPAKRAMARMMKREN
jgi:hypothetical protein